MANTDDFIISVDCSGPGGFPLISKTGYNIASLTAANFDATITAAHNLEQAYEPLTSGVVKAENFTHTININTGYPSGVANRGSKWIVTAVNSNGDIFTHTIPAASALTADLNADMITAKLTSTHWAAYLTAFAALAVSPAGDALTVLRAKLGGRRR